MNYIVLSDSEGGTGRLTTDSPASNGGVPVLEIDTEDVNGTFGPSDLIGDIDKPETLTRTASLVAAWASEPDRTEDELTAAHRFLHQWPEGPNVGDAE
jgi:hypothetical protein